MISLDLGQEKNIHITYHMISLSIYESCFLHEENTTQISIDVSRKLPKTFWNEPFLKIEILSDATILRVHNVWNLQIKNKGKFSFENYWVCGV